MSSLRKSVLALAVGLTTLAASPAAMAAQQSMFGCHDLETNQILPAVEGKAGYFFRVAADLRMQNVVTDAGAQKLADFAAALKSKGTTLIYAPIPTKGQTLLAFLPDDARLYGFDPKVAQQVYRDQIERLRDHGVIAVDLINALSASDPAKGTFFQADFHWTSLGSEHTAMAIADAIKSLPDYAEVSPKTFKTTNEGEGQGISTMRRSMQPYCADALPLPKTPIFVTAEATDPSATVDIFDSGTTGGDIALVGTSFSDAGPQNFAGFLEQYTGMAVSNFGITGGNQFGSITSYITSKEFYDNRPRYLIWENPVYNSLAQFGPGPMDELIASAAGKCTALPKQALAVAADGTVDIDLEKQKVAQNSVLLADAGNEASREVVLNFKGAGQPLRQEVTRSDRLRSTGRFFVPFAPIPEDHLASVSVKFDRLSPQDFSISLCTL